MLADRDPFLQEYANIDKFRSTKYYIKTSFHKKILALLTTKKQNLDEKIEYMNGIQGMGKTTSLIYFVLQCLNLEVVKDDIDKIMSLTEIGEETSESLKGKGREVYSFINGRYIISPRLLKYFQTQILYGRSIADAYAIYMEFDLEEGDKYRQPTAQ
ncbi:uncharacterized protein LOC127728955 [Mytilus californianus]|uniref:uncharacterized protein LOC127728955 n=1 Tax=Mytilus californianus TaxID=6549 RepID=UPI0022483D6D|nr:uncharacterized protein LOC127728955 [Mytilus californianus]